MQEVEAEDTGEEGDGDDDCDDEAAYEGGYCIFWGQGGAVIIAAAVLSPYSKSALKSFSQRCSQSNVLVFLKRNNANKHSPKR